MIARAKALLRRVGPKLAYPAFYLFCLVVFFTWTFPYDRLKERIVAQFNARQRASAHPQELQIDELDSSFVTGVKATGVRLISPATEAGKPPSVLTMDRARARISLLGLLVGTTAVTFRVEAFDGAIEGSFEEGSKTRELDVTLDGVDLGRVDAIAASAGFPLEGRVSGSLKLSLPEGKASKGAGSLALEIKDMAAGTAKELAIKTPMGPFSLPRLRVGTVTVTGEAKDGVLKLSKIAAQGADVDVSGEGKVQLRDTSSEDLDVNLKLKILDGYRSKNDTTKLLFGAPGSKEKPMIELEPKMARAKTADGAYALHIGGVLGKPDVQPGAGGAASAGSAR